MLKTQIIYVQDAPGEAGQSIKVGLPRLMWLNPVASRCLNRAFTSVSTAPDGSFASNWTGRLARWMPFHLPVGVAGA